MESGRVALAGLLGRCPAMESLKREVVRFGPSGLRVHVFGETGTGKEMVAKALHEASPRARRPLRAGERGRLQRRAVRVRALRPRARGVHGGGRPPARATWPQAEGGTLFIDEVGDMSPLAQVRLLRFLEAGEYQRLGRDGRAAGRRAGDQRDERGPRSGACGRGGSARTCGSGWPTRSSSLPPLRERGSGRAPPRAALPPRAGGRARGARRRCCRPRRRRRSSPTPGRATCGSSRARCGGSACGPPAGRSRSRTSRRGCRSAAPGGRGRCARPSGSARPSSCRTRSSATTDPRARRRGARHHPPGPLAEGPAARPRRRRPVSGAILADRRGGGRRGASRRERRAASGSGRACAPSRAAGGCSRSPSSRSPRACRWASCGSRSPPGWRAPGVDIKVIGLFTLAQAPWSLQAAVVAVDGPLPAALPRAASGAGSSSARSPSSRSAWGSPACRATPRRCG